MASEPKKPIEQMLEALAKAGADLEVVFARRTPEQPGQGILFAGPIAGLIGRRIGSKWPLAAGMALVAAAAGSLAAWHDEPWEILAAMPVLGVGVGMHAVRVSRPGGRWRARGSDP